MFINDHNVENIENSASRIGHLPPFNPPSEALIAHLGWFKAAFLVSAVGLDAYASEFFWVWNAANGVWQEHFNRTNVYKNAGLTPPVKLKKMDGSTASGLSTGHGLELSNPNALWTKHNGEVGYTLIITKKGNFSKLLEDKVQHFAIGGSGKTHHSGLLDSGFALGLPMFSNAHHGPNNDLLKVSLFLSYHLS